MSDGAKGMHLSPDHEEIDQSPYLSGASTATSIDNSSLPIRPDIHPYLEIGKCLQSLRRSVFDMYHEELQRSPHFQPNQPSSAERDSTPTGGSSSNPHDVLMTPGISLAASLRTFHTNAEGNAHKSQHSVSFQLDEPTVSSDQKPLYADISSERVALDDASTSTVAMVTHSIATIVNQHEEKFVRYAPTDGSNSIFVDDTCAVIIILHCYHFAVCSLSKEIDYWKTQADSLAQKLQETDATYTSKIDSVLAEQEYLAAQQQQVLRELNAAIAAHQVTTQQQQGDATAAAMGTGSSPPSGTVRTPELVT